LSQRLKSFLNSISRSARSKLCSIVLQPFMSHVFSPAPLPGATMSRKSSIALLTISAGFTLFTVYQKETCDIIQLSMLLCSRIQMPSDDDDKRRNWTNYPACVGGQTNDIKFDTIQPVESRVTIQPLAYLKFASQREDSCILSLYLFMNKMSAYSVIQPLLCSFKLRFRSLYLFKQPC